MWLMPSRNPPDFHRFPPERQVEVPQMQYEDQIVHVPVQKQARMDMAGSPGGT